MKAQAILAGLVTGGVVGLLLFFLAGLFLALAIAAPLAVVISLMAEQAEKEVSGDTH